MKTFLLITSFLALLGSPRVWERTQAPADLGPALTSTDGVSLSEADGLRVSVQAQAGTITGGKVCAYYRKQSVDGGSDQWVRNGNLDLTITAPTTTDGGTASAVVLPDLQVINQFGRVAFLACGVTGTATDGGVNWMTVRTEAFGKNLP